MCAESKPVVVVDEQGQIVAFSPWMGETYRAHCLIYDNGEWYYYIDGKLVDSNKKQVIG